MKYRWLGLAAIFLLVATLACGGNGDETPQPPPPTTAPPPPTSAPPDTPPDTGTGGLDFGQEPNFGEVGLEAGFSPDPYTVELLSGGDVDVGAENLGMGCTGYATSAPDYRLSWSGDSSELRIFFVSDDGDDTTLVVNDPNSDWLCNDDYSGWDPMVSIDDPSAGQYDIWVGSYSADEFIAGVLYITELALEPSDYSGGVSPDVGGGGLDWALDPNYGSVDLSAGFAPDPHMVSMTSGGSVDVYEENLGSGCGGYATSAPDYRIFWSGSSANLRIFFTAVDDEDTRLVVNDASGDWHCNDDYVGWDPLVDIADPPPGQIDIWVASFSSGEYVEGTLYVTELDYDPGNLP